MSGYEFDQLAFQNQTNTDVTITAEHAVNELLYHDVQHSQRNRITKHKHSDYIFMYVHTCIHCYGTQHSNMDGSIT